MPKFVTPIRSALLVCLIAASALPASGSRAEVPLGAAPGYATRQVTAIPNAQAITRRIWIPGIDDGYVPQGMLFLNGKLFVSSYQSTDPNKSRGPCRLFVLDAMTGEARGHLDLPASCGHAGGLTEGRPGFIIVADTRVVFEVELIRGTSEPLGRVVRTARLEGAVKGSFAASEHDGFWLGTYAREEGARLFKFPWAALDKPQLSEPFAVAAVPLPPFAQGAAFDRTGRLWITRSGSKFGDLVRLNRTSGAIEARFEMPIGVEGISFEPDGALWTLSEAGSKRWSAWSAFYPLALRFDMSLLK